MKETFSFSENVVGYMIQTELDQETMDDILSKVKDRLKIVSPICLYLEDETNEGISVGGFLKALEFHFSHSRDLDRVAIVTDDTLFRKSMEFKDIVVPANLKTFKRSERVQAMNWVMQ